MDTSREPGAHGFEAEYKQCPDCAEDVLAAARKCRYCGYRFDGGRKERGPLLGGLIPGFRSSSSASTLPEVLADWGVSISEAEEVRFFCLADVDDRRGYLLVTSWRLIFFGQTSRYEHEKALELSLLDVAEVAVLGGPRRRRLELRGPEFRHLVHGTSSAEIERLGHYLAEDRPR